MPRLTETQKNFKKQMKQLEKEGKLDNLYNIYNKPIRKKAKVSNVVSIIIIVITVVSWATFVIRTLDIKIPTLNPKTFSLNFITQKQAHEYIQKTEFVDDQGFIEILLDFNNNGNKYNLTEIINKRAKIDVLQEQIKTQKKDLMPLEKVLTNLLGKYADILNFIISKQNKNDMTLDEASYYNGLINELNQIHLEEHTEIINLLNRVKMEYTIHENYIRYKYNDVYY